MRGSQPSGIGQARLVFLTLKFGIVAMFLVTYQLLGRLVGLKMEVFSQIILADFRVFR